jgi:hypothetical protein
MPNSIINSDDGVVSGQSGIKTTGGDDGILAIQSNGVTVFDTAPTQVVARQTFYAIDSGVPIVARATDSNAYKIGMQDTAGGTQRGFLGANSTNALMVANGSSTNVMNVTSAGLFQMNSGYGSVATAYGVRAWARFNGVTSTINASGNISSVTDISTGNASYRLNFASALVDSNYAAAGSFYGYSSLNWTAFMSSVAQTASYCDVRASGYVSVSGGYILAEVANATTSNFTECSIMIVR